MRKKTFLALMLAAVMLLSGCALVTVDEEVDNARTVIDVNGEIVTKGELKTVVENQIQQNEQMNQFYMMYLGMSANLPTTGAGVLDDVAQNYIQTLVIQQKARELGLYTMTDEETAEIQETAQSEYDELIENIKTNYFADSTLDEEALRAACEQYAIDHGPVTLEDYVEAATDEKAAEKLRADAIKDVTVTEEDLEAALDERVISDQATYDSSPNTYGSNVNNGTTVYYAPAGYRYVKQILVMFTDEDTAAVTEANTALTTAQNNLTSAQSALDNAAEDADLEALQAAVDEAQAAVDEAQAALDAAMATACANIQEKTDEIYAAATAEDADFDALVAEYNEDTGMPAVGYAIREGFTDFVASFTEAGMALQNVGDVSAPVASNYGYHILQYSADIPEGRVALDDVRDTLQEELLTARQDETYNTALETWISEATVTTYLDRMGY